MEQRVYNLVTRSAALLILALFAAPVWDAWRYRGLASSGGATFTLGAIMPGRRAPGKDSTAQAAGTAAPAGVPPAPAAGAAPSTAPRPGATARVPQPAQLPDGSTAAGSSFEAWSARAQIDPFWDGVTPPRRQASTGADGTGEAADSREGRHDVAGAPTKRGDSREARRATGGTGKPGRHPGRSADGEGDDGDADTPPPAGEAPQDAPAAGALWQVGAPSPTPTPTPTPDPVNPPLVNPSRVPGVIATPGDPEPDVTPVPLVSALVATPDVARGDSILVTVRIQDADRMTSLPFHLGFDPGVIEFEGSQAGTALAALEPILLASVSPNRPGDLAVGLSLVELAGVFTGTGDLVTLRFRALAPGTSDLSFSRATLRGARSQAIEVRFADGAVTVH